MLHLGTGVNVSISEDASAARAKLPETERSLRSRHHTRPLPSCMKTHFLRWGRFTVQSRCELVEHVLGTLCGHVSRWQHVQYGRITHSSFQWIRLVVHCSCMCVVGIGEHMSSVQLVFIPLSFFLTQFEAVWQQYCRHCSCTSTVTCSCLSYPSSPRNVT